MPSQAHEYLFDAPKPDGDKTRYKPLSVRFWAKVEKTCGCWNWIGAKVPDGYGSVNLGRHHGKKSMKAHRVAWLLLVGPIGDGLHVLHKCDNRACVNPKHLFLGTNNDNVADRVAKGRSARVFGERCPNAKLSDAARIEIANSNLPTRELCLRFGVSMSAVQRIRRSANATSST